MGSQADLDEIACDVFPYEAQHSLTIFVRVYNLDKGGRKFSSGKVLEVPNEPCLKRPRVEQFLPAHSRDRGSSNNFLRES